MGIYLSDEFIAQMPESRRIRLLNWYSEYLNESSLLEEVPIFQECSESPAIPTQLTLPLNFDSSISEDKSENSHVRLSQLFKHRITERGMLARVRLKKDVAEQRGCTYIYLELSSKGTIFYNEQEFDKPSPLAKKVNGSSCNGWEYIEIWKDNHWICLDKLRKMWRKNNA